MELLVLDKNLESIFIIDNFESLIWTERYFKCGDFEIYTTVTEDLLKYAKQDNYLWYKDSEHVMIIEGVQITADVEDGICLIINGRSLESMLDRRIIWKQTVLSGNFQDGIKKLIDENIISPEIVERKIENFIFKVSEDEKITTLTIDAQFEMGDNLYDAIQKLCESKKIGFRITLNTDNQFVFELYSGIDRSYTQFKEDKKNLMLLHGDDIKDSSPYSLQIENHGVLISEKQKKFGKASLYFDGNSYLTIPSNLLNFENYNFTIDWWEFAETGAKTRFCTQYGVAQTGMSVGNGGTGLFVNSNFTIPGWDIINVNVLTVDVGIWVHWAFIRNGNSFVLYKNGTKIYQKDSVDPIVIDDTKPFALGSNPAGDHKFKGYIAEFHIYKDAIWTENFIPPKKPYDSSDNFKMNDYVIFSPKFDNLINSNYLESTKTLKTIALVGGEGEDTNRKTITVESETMGAGTGLTRRELFVDARGISTTVDGEELSSSEYREQMKQKGREELSKNSLTKSFEGQVETTQIFVYGVDFFKGDIVQIENEYGIQSKSRVIEVVRSQATDGIDVYPTFETVEDNETEGGET